MRSKSNLTLFSHFFNEEFLLPIWIKHHQNMFEHAVLVDYGSTDSSVDIIRELAPNWEIRKTRNRYFEEPAIGKEIMDIEQEFNGWKMVLNTTEFLMSPNLKKYASKLESKGHKGTRTSGVILVDTPETRGEFDPDIPLVLQKTNGYFENDIFHTISTTGVKQLSRSRLFHNQPCGKYSKGRHGNSITSDIDRNFILCWAGWSPFDYVKERKKQMQHKVSDHQKTKKIWAGCYCVNDEQLEEMFKKESARSYDLLSKERFKTVYDAFRRVCD